MSAPSCSPGICLRPPATPTSFHAASAVFGSFLGQLVLFGYTFALLLHMLGGLRHAIWDAGYGFEAEERDRLALGSVIVAAALTVLIWIVVLILR